MAGSDIEACATIKASYHLSCIKGFPGNSQQAVLLFGLSESMLPELSFRRCLSEQYGTCERLPL